MSSKELRKIFVEFFEKHNHKNVRSSSLVPLDDPTLLFINAGMVQFKRVFMGEDKRDYSRAVTYQKCVRAGGKHNDLENVGYTARHHTFFEMLGNFSFGDYFKEKAIEFAWDLLTNGYKLPKDKLWISIYMDDDEAFSIWHDKIGIPAEKIVRMGEKDNFWAMGDTGPCGPCSEIHIDRGPEHGCGRADCKLGCDCDRYLELWNLVFMQFNRDESGKMTPLPKPSIDTGMGLERIASVLQGAKTNYETDLFIPIMKKVETLSGLKIGDSEASDVAMKVIADHSRASCFLIGDGVLPSNEGRGYVLRRIMRRAIRYGRQIGLVKPFLHNTCEVVIDMMEDVFPELKDSRSFIINVVENEEKRFSETLDAGLKHLEDAVESLENKNISTVPGELVFKLYDTYGFPPDIVRDMLSGKGYLVDMNGFDLCMEKQRQMSRKEVAFESATGAYKDLSSKGFKTEFCGYDTLESEGRIVKIIIGDKEVDSAEKGIFADIVMDKTPFYAKSGGQCGDLGIIRGDGFYGKILDTINDPSGIRVHKLEVLEGEVKKDLKVSLEVDPEKRADTARNHTATHLLHAALKNVLGDHIKQAGSLVANDRLRFDFTHFSPVSPKEIAEIEKWINERIRENFLVSIEEMSMDDAVKSGATALFEEKYGEIVRVISIDDVSMELCGGTHTSRTGNIGFFKIISEAGIAAGVRRIEALTGEKAVSYIQEREEYLQSACMFFRDKPESLLPRIEKLGKQVKSFEKEIESLKVKAAEAGAGNLEDGLREINGIKVLSKKVSVDNPGALRDLGDKIKNTIKSGVFLLGAESGGKVLLLCGVTKDLTNKFHAGNLVRETALIVGGGGGGRPDLAQAGGSDPGKLDNALENFYELAGGYKG
ncbi:MAG: alanine--tRNA ligase [Deltaproteobacteria bacterium]|nr:MAG: alanine--tRNA ligase [Deltaproteobacteria bacterium]PIE75033.1 MAG: alanine--tRNA ligase [Deltaproteobacteria bacterium]